MKVILTKDIEGLGKAGEVVRVKDGHGRNFLIPKGVARVATSSNLKVVEEEKKKLLRLKEKEKEKGRELAEQISKVSCTISVQAGQDDKLFGTVTTEAIAEVCESEGIKIDKRDIRLDEPIKKLGVYQVAVKVHPEVTATLKVWVVKA